MAIGLLCKISNAQQPGFATQENILILPAADAMLAGGLALHKYQDLEKDPKMFAVQSSTGNDQSLTWVVTLPEKGHYNIAVLLEVKKNNSPVVFQVRSGLDSTSLQLPGTEWNRVFFPKEILMDAGKQEISLKITSGLPKQPVEINIYSLEVATKKVWERKKITAGKLRSRPSWLTNARYGLFFHWNARSQPRTGQAKSYQEAVKDFNVPVFADMIESTGADFIVLTTSWDLQTFPAPLKTLDQLMPGNTTSRDLIADLADALNRRNIKLLVYCNFRLSRLGWKKEDRNTPGKTEAFFEKLTTIYNEIGKRYAHKIAGLWIDDGMGLYPYNAPFEAITSAVKRDDKEMVIGYNSWIYPKFTDFQDFYGGEHGITFSAAGVNDPHLPVGGNGYFISGAQEGLKATFCGLMEPGDWTHTQPNQEIPPPLLTSDTLIKIVKEARLRKNVPVMNVQVYQDGSISPLTHNLLMQLKEAL